MKIKSTRYFSSSPFRDAQVALLDNVLFRKTNERVGVLPEDFTRREIELGTKGFIEE